MKVGQTIYSTGLKSKKPIVFGLFLCALAMGVATASAQEAAATRLQTQSQRANTIEAVQAYNKGDWQLAEEKIRQTQDPFAAKLFHWLIFTRGPKEGWSDAKFVRLTHFIRQNPDWPGIRNLRLRAESKMPEGQPPQDVVAWYADFEPLTATGMDRYLAALISTGRKSEAKKYLSEWWSSDTSMSREEQRGIYNRYGSLLGRDDHRKRMDALLYAGHYQNARAVAGVLGNGYPELAEARIALAGQKGGGVNVLLAKVPQRLQSDPGLLYERLRWRRRNKDDVGALEILHNAPDADDILNAEDWWQERHIIIRRMMERRSFESAYLLASEHGQSEGLSYAQAEWMAGWLALRFLHKPEEALKRFEALYEKVETPISKSRAAYWAGRATKELGQVEASEAWYQKAAALRTTYYGQLAAGELSLENKLPSAAPPVITTEDKYAFDSSDLVQAARILHNAGMRHEASQFIQAFVKKEETPKGYRYAAEMAADMEQYHDAIRIAKDATKEGMFLTSQSYPVIAKHLQGVPLEWSLVHALIRQESMFDFDAVSPAGALGLMQIMPATAKEVARKKGISHSTDRLTRDPAHNIRLGTAYLDQMLDRFNGSYVLAIAAYNAGPGRVDQWIETFGDPRTGAVDMVDWIEMIPIYETRNYVQRVMEGVYVYRLRLHGIQKRPQEPLYIAMRQSL